MAIFMYMLLCLLPALVFELIARGLHKWSTHDNLGSEKPRERRRDRAERPDQQGRTELPGARPVAIPISAQFVRPNCDRYRTDLLRLSYTHDRLEIAEIPGRALRLRAVEMAYDDILRDACVAFELERPPDHLDSVTRVQVEADLLTAGLRW
jgi:hypothetical protein